MDAHDIVDRALARLVAEGITAATKKAAQHLEPHVAKVKAQRQFDRLPQALAAQQKKEAEDERRARRVEQAAKEQARIDNQNKAMQDALESDKRRQQAASLDRKRLAATAGAAQVKPHVPAGPSVKTAPSTTTRKR